MSTCFIKSVFAHSLIALGFSFVFISPMHTIVCQNHLDDNRKKNVMQKFSTRHSFGTGEARYLTAGLKIFFVIEFFASGLFTV
ncbi:hypothetical protein MHYP_G00252230 [Metynnis hypsauchen]